MDVNLKLIFSIAAIILTMAAFVPYLYSILKGQLRPHVFSWVIWGTTTVIVALAQYQAKGGVGVWPMALSGGFTLLIASLAVAKRGDISITRLDWVFFLSALLSVPLWYVLSDPLWAVVLLTVIDLLGFGPTVRKAFADPHQESIWFFALFMLRNTLVVLALEQYSVTTVLFPGAIAIACSLLIGLIVVRRKMSQITLAKSQ